MTGGLLHQEKRTHNQYLIGCFFFSSFFSDVSAQRYVGTASQDFPDYCLRYHAFLKMRWKGKREEERERKKNEKKLAVIKVHH